jgi:hypothetical protein
MADARVLLIGAASIVAAWFYTGGKRPYGYLASGEPGHYGRSPYLKMTRAFAPVLETLVPRVAPIVGPSGSTGRSAVNRRWRGGVGAARRTTMVPRSKESAMLSAASRWFITAALVCAGTLVTPAGSGATATPEVWDPAVSLEGPAPGIAPADTVVAPDGSMAVVWEIDGQVQLARRSPGGAWVSSDIVTLNGHLPQVEVDGSGAFYVAWSRGRRILERRRTAGGRWSNSVVAMHRPVTVTLADFDVNAKGAGLLGVYAGRGALTKRRTATGGWSRPTRWVDARRLDIELGDSGLAAAMMTLFRPESPGSDFGARTEQVVRQRAGRSWGRPKVLLRDPNAGPPWPGLGGLAVNGRGTTTVAWYASGGSVMAARAKAGVRWRRAVALAPSGPLVEHEINASATAEGTVLVAFVRRYTTIKSVLRPAGGPWGERVTVTPRGRFINDYDVALDPSGRALAVWARNRTGAAGSLHRDVSARLMNADGSWSTETRLAGRGATAPVGATGHGDAVVAWAQPAAPGDFRIQVRTYLAR